jgi:hypothetical protein
MSHPHKIIEILRRDYQNFPDCQTYSIYDAQVYFQDPLTKFCGIERYQKTIKFIATFFRDIHLEVQAIERNGATIRTEWTLYMTSPLPWQPRLMIPGWSELELNSDELIISHIDRWRISPLALLLQNFFFRKKGSQ